MTRTKLAARLAVLAALALACTGDPKRSGQEGPIVENPPPGDNVPPGDGWTPPPPDDVTPPPDAEPCTTLTLRFRGVNPGDATAYALDVDDVAILDDGAPVDVSGERTGTLDMLRLDHAYDLGTVALGTIALPDCPKRLRAVIRLAGGAVDVPGAAVVFDPLSPPISFPIDTGAVVPGNCHAVVHLDLAGSLGTVTPAADERVFLPRFNVHY